MAFQEVLVAFQEGQSFDGIVISFEKKKKKMTSDSHPESFPLLDTPPVASAGDR